MFVRKMENEIYENIEAMGLSTTVISKKHFIAGPLLFRAVIVSKFDV